MLFLSLSLFSSLFFASVSASPHFVPGNETEERIQKEEEDESHGASGISIVPSFVYGLRKGGL